MPSRRVTRSSWSSSAACWRTTWRPPRGPRRCSYPASRASKSRTRGALTGVLRAPAFIRPLAALGRLRCGAAFALPRAHGAPVFPLPASRGTRPGEEVRDGPHGGNRCGGDRGGVVPTAVLLRSQAGPLSWIETIVTLCGMVGLEAMVLGRLGRKPSPHPGACVLSYPSPTIRGPGSLGHGHLTRPAVLAHNTRRYGHSPSGSPGPIGAARCGHSRRRELRMYGVLGSSHSLGPVPVGVPDSNLLPTSDCNDIDPYAYHGHTPRYDCALIYGSESR